MKLTIAIPYSTNLPLLKCAVKSVLAQTSPDWTAFVCCDNPGDETLEPWIASLNEPRLKVFKNPRRLGMAHNFNRCLELTETQWVTLLHDDDELLPTYVEEVLRGIERHPEAAAVYTDGEIFNEEGRRIFSLPDLVKAQVRPQWDTDLKLKGDWGLSYLITGNFILAPSLCFNRSKLNGKNFSDRWIFVVDWDLTCRILLDGGTIVGLPVQGVRYRRRSGNTTANMTKDQSRFIEEFNLINEVLRAAKSKDWKRTVGRARLKPVLRLHLAYQALCALKKADIKRMKAMISMMWSEGREA